MAPSKFAVYQHFNRREDLEAVVEVLQDNAIPVRISDEEKSTGEWNEPVIIGAPMRPKFWIEIPADQFEKANFMLQEAAEENLSEEDLDAHPFNGYSVQELQQVLVEESDWSPEAVVVARRLLLRRGKDVDLKRLRDASRARLLAEYQPISVSSWKLWLVTILAVFAGLAVWIVGIMLLLGIILYYAFGSRRDPKGVRHEVYDAETRKKSRLALIALVISVGLGLVNLFYLLWVPVPDIDSWLWWWR